jgi:mannose/fructose/N-acetylgalactosamine-specific phosphotransferase system component IIB
VLSVQPALVRIDDRLLHGQVSHGWVPALGSKLVVIANDSVAGDDWLAEVYAGAVPPGVRLEVLTLGAAADRFADLSDASLVTILLMKTPADALALVESGARPESINVGGMHFERGKRKLLPYLFVDDRDVGAFRGLLDRGIELVAQDVPGGRRHEVAALLEAL